jgi:hypothetical protein
MRGDLPSSELPPGVVLPEGVTAAYEPSAASAREAGADADDWLAQIAALRDQVAALSRAVRALQGPKGASHVFLVSQSGTSRLWAEHGLAAGGTSLAAVAGGRACSATNAAEGPLVVRGTGHTAVLELRAGTFRAYVPVSGGLGFYNGTTNVALNAPFHQAGTSSGFFNVFQFQAFTFPAGGPSAGLAGVRQEFRLPSGPGNVLYGNSNTAGWDLLHFTE